MSRAFQTATSIMVAAIILYSLYPPFANFLLQRYAPLQLAVILHSAAAVAMLMAPLVSRNIRRALAFCVSKANVRRRRMLATVVFSGAMIAANHLLFYEALRHTDRFDVTAILVFETWPILFFLLDTAMTRGVRSTLKPRDYAMVFITFFGYSVLMLQELDLVDWLLVDESIFYVTAFALAGGFAMTINTFARRRAMLSFRDDDTDEIIGGMTALQASIVVEIGVRIAASAALILTFWASGAQFEPVAQSDLVIALFVGGVALAGGSALYDLGVFKAPNAAIAALWYLMPVGSLIVLSALQERLINQYEAVASTLIISANILISLRYSLNSSFTMLYAFTVVAGCWCIFAPGLGFDGYFELVAVSTIFYALLSTYALNRISENVRAKDVELLQFQEELRSIQTHRITPPMAESLRAYGAAIVAMAVEPQKRSDERITAAESMRAMKSRLSAVVNVDQAMRDALRSLVASGDRLTAAIENRMTGGEYVVLSLLAVLNVVLIIVLRGDGIIYDIFALTVAAAAAYLIFLIHEQDRANLNQFDHYLTLTGIIAQIKRLRRGVRGDAIAGALGRAEATARNFLREHRSSFTLSLCVFVFAFSGFIYALAYQDFLKQRQPENAPIGLSAIADGGDSVGVAAPNWPSARIKAEILKVVAERFLGLDVTLYSADNRSIFEAMGSPRGQIDVHPEVWVANVPELTRRYVEALQTVRLTDRSEFGSQGLCVNRAAIERGFTPKIDQLSDPESAALFDLDGDGRGEIWFGAEDWSSTTIEMTRANAYGYGEAFEPLVFDEPLLLAALRLYDETDRPFLFFCYTPHFLIEGFGAVRVAEPASDAAAWSAIVEAQEPDAPRPTRGAPWPDTPIKIAYSTRVEQRRPNLVRLLGNFSIPDSELGRLSYEMAVEERAPAAIARQWVDANESLILEWVLP